MSQSSRRSNTLERLKQQLINTTKPAKENGKTTDILIKLTLKDIERIKKEIQMLESK
jgi:hypothetical protein